MAVAQPVPKQLIPFSNGKDERRMTRVAEIRQIQRSMRMAAIDETNELRDRASAARAYADLERLRRAMDMEPDPKPMDVSPEAIAARAKLIPVKSVTSFDPDSEPPPTSPSVESTTQ
jgi:hypothetical protein